MYFQHLIIISLLIIVANSGEISTETISSCKKLISRRQFIIQSPGYPNGYPNNITCEYNLKGHEICLTEYHFQLLDFDLENSVNCSKDRLKIGDQNVLCGFINGVKIFKSKSDVLRLKFVSDDVTSGRGFKILVTRLPCNDDATNLNAKVGVEIDPNRNSKLPKCCENSYNSRRFYLASPGFPYTNRAQTDCLYHINRANPNICRLRIHFKYFWSGFEYKNNCHGFFEIDNKRICGCRSGLDVISQFDQTWGNNPKIIRFRNEGYPKSVFSGFVIEVIQDECPTRYFPSLESNSTISNNSNTKIPEFFFYNDQLNRLSWPSIKNTSTQLTKREIQNKSDDLKIDYYFFKSPDFDYTEISENHKEREPREYFETTSTDFLLSNGNNYSKCRAWGILQWTMLTNEILWKKMPQCQITQELNPNKCCDIKNYRGYLTSPGYPFYYQRNLNICYRFHKIKDFCGVKIYFLDFDLEPSENCYKDSLILYDNYKYCGNQLYNYHFTYDLNNQYFQDMKFVSDNFYCGRGFKLFYEHVPCEYTTTYEPPLTTTPYPPVENPCGGELTSESFSLSIPRSNVHCVYYVRKNNQNVCGLQVLFVNFELKCGIEYLLVNNRQYCGNLTGQTVFSTFDLYNTVNVVYQRRMEDSPVLSSILLRGQQVKGDCDPFIWEVPAERRLQVNPEMRDNTENV